LISPLLSIVLTKQKNWEQMGVWNLTFAMKTFRLISTVFLRGTVLALLATATSLTQAANVLWTGPIYTNIHASFSATLDKLTTNHVGADAVNNVWLTRGSRAPLYNAAAEVGWNGFTPANTQWALASANGLPPFTPITSAPSLIYGNFADVVGQPGGPSPSGSVGKTFYVKIVTDNIYLSLKLTAWGASDGGSFTYERSTPAVVLPTPTVAITNPPSGSVFAAPANVSIGANAAVSSGTVTNVQFFTNGVSAGSALTAPFSLTANNLTAGSYALKAIATAAGISATSTVVNITVVSPPTISLTNPPSGTVFAAPANLKLGASASVSGSTVTNVQFFANGALQGAVAVSPFTLTSSGLTAGSYALTAVATASGISTTSAVVNVSVVNPVALNLSGASANNGQFSFGYTANAGLSYVVQSSTNLFDWVSLVTNVAPGNPVLFTNALNPAGIQFYRVGLLPNP
jgi:hypothetical protein